MPEQRFEPPAAGHHVGVEEGDEVRSSHAASPVLRAAAGPLLAAWRSTRMSQCGPAKSPTSTGIDDPSSTTTTRMPRND